MQKSLKELIAGTRELQALPATTMRLMELLDDVTIDARHVLDVIEKDPSLTANMLKLSNSAFYGLRRKVASARDALILLGNQTVVTLAFAASMGDILRGPLAAYGLARNSFWYHALGTGIGAAHLASVSGDREVRERAFTAGLVHDIGKLILNRPLKECLEQVPKEGSFPDLLHAEYTILGFNHAEAGALLGESWNFPTELVNVIRYHHDPSELEENGEVTRCVSMANIVTCKLGFSAGTGEVSDEVFWATVEDLGFDEETINDLNIQLPIHLESMLELLGESLKPEN